MVKAQREKDWMCGTCGYVMDASIATDGPDVTPREQDITLCINCGGVHVREAGKWRPVTTREFTALTPGERADVCKAQRTIRKLIPIDPRERGGTA